MITCKTCANFRKPLCANDSRLKKCFGLPYRPGDRIAYRDRPSATGATVFEAEILDIPIPDGENSVYEITGSTGNGSSSQMIRFDQVVAKVD